MNTPRPGRLPFLLLALLVCHFSFADGPSDNAATKVRPVPPPGLVIADSDRAELQAGVAELGGKLESLGRELQGKPEFLDLLPDVLIYHKAVHWALDYNEFFKTNEVGTARRLLKRGMERAEELHQRSPSWTSATGLVVRGFLSRIDGSVQPYGLVVPASFRAGSSASHRLDFWFHGRGETLTELDFINGRERSLGEFTPPHAFVLHSYGRYCNGNKFAGETDAFEALDHARRHYPIDENRLVVRGFSLGGAACWHMAVHYASRWAAAAPGAGFSETPDFLKVFQKEDLKPTWYEQKLWHMYDCTDWAQNLYQCPTVAYSGEIDSQKQAADMMAKAMARQGLELVHVIGPKTAHSYHPEAKKEVNRRIDGILEQPRNAFPNRVRFTTYTLKYNQMNWVIVDGLDAHWEAATVDAELGRDDNSVRITTRNVSAFTLSFEPGRCPLDPARPPRVFIDGHKPSVARIGSDRSWQAHFQKSGSRWESVAPAESSGTLRKRHDLQGPIDDAFTGSFLVVRPTGPAWHEATGRWVASEMSRATNEWRRQFRGDVRLKDDRDVSDEDIAAHHLILWGDPSSNRLLSRLAEKLPLTWTERELRIGKREFNASHHVAVLIHPNPLNPRRYVVLNSGFTFREYDYLNNARQVSKLPDYAILNTRVAPGFRWPGEVVLAGFFDEDWQPAAKGLGPQAQK